MLDDQEISRKLSLAGTASTIKKVALGMQGGKGLERVYILERDSKMVYMYDVLTRNLTKRGVNIPNKFEHNF